MKHKKIAVALLLLVSAEAARAYTIEGAKWDSGTVSFYLDLGQYNPIAAHELTVWDQYTGDTHLRATNNATTNGGFWFHDGRNSIEWSDDVGWDLPSNILAVTAFYSLNQIGANDGIMRESDILINPDFDWAAGSYDLGRVLLHEIGHAIGLGHSDIYGAVMYPYIFPGDTSGLGADDIAGAKFLYGPRTGTVPDTGTTLPLLGMALTGLFMLVKPNQIERTK